MLFRSWTWTRGKHSAKPEAFQDMVEAVSPGPRLELFARRARPGWTVWGNEVEANVRSGDLHNTGALSAQQEVERG